MSRFEDQANMFNQRLTRLEHGARQLRLTMEADGQANLKTRERTEGAATAVQAMHGDSCTAQKVQNGPKTSISFGVKAGPPDLPCKEDVLVEDGAAMPKSCLPPMEMRTTIAAGSSRRRNLHRNGDHLQQAASSVLRDRRDESKEKKCMDFNSIRPVRQQLLETASCPFRPEGYRDKTDSKYDVRSRWFSRSSPRLPVYENVVRVGSW